MDARNIYSLSSGCGPSLLELAVGSMLYS